MGQPIVVEICVGDVESAIAAEAGGADRVELCDNLAVGGTTPSAGTIAEACRWVSLPVHVLIRPRGGGFIYSARELAVMRRDIEAAKALGAAGVVLGVLDAEGRVDRGTTADLVAAARPMSVTFHKAVDRCRDVLEAMDILLAIGVDRVLTSGGRATALEGCEMLRRLVDRAAGRAAILAGGRLAAAHLREIIRRGGVNEVHLGSAACRSGPEPAGGPGAPDDASWNRTDALLVKSIVDLVRDASEQTEV